jgi:mono/diheme cytochrome c family protein
MLKGRLLGLATCGLLALALGACGDENRAPKDADLIAGKQLFVKSCGSCHTLGRANTTGKQGPDLDEAFRQSLQEGFGRASVRGVVHQQILYPARLPKTSPAYMPAKLVEGKRAHDVAAYVASVTGLGGKDSGLLASAVKPAGAGKPVAEKNGTLAIPADPGGQLAYITKQATAKPGKVEILSKNAASIPHDIAISGNGVNDKGEVVQGGATSRIDVTLKPGRYQFFCTVQGHREGGMEGTLTVK